jgi:hypothetical protein
VANPGDRRSYKHQLYKLRRKSGRHIGRSTTLGCTDDEEAKRGALLHGRLSRLGRILECGAQLAKNKLITMFGVLTVAACITKLTG